MSYKDRYKEYKTIYKERGLKALIKEKGWVIVGILFIFFLTKGLLYLLIGKQLFSLFT